MRLLDVDIEFLAHFRNPLRRDQAALGRVADDEQVLYIPRRAPREMLHASFVVNHHVLVMAAETVHYLAQVVVDRAVTTGAFAAPHGNQIKAAAFGQR